MGVTRGNKVFQKVLPLINKKCCIGAKDGPPEANDIFLHALFARLTLNNNDTIEFETKFNPNTNTIELDLPPEAQHVLDQLTGIQRGPNFQLFINWLIGSQTLPGACPWTINTLTTTDATPATIAVVLVPDDTIAFIMLDVSGRRVDAPGGGGFGRRTIAYRYGGGPATIINVTDTSVTRRTDPVYDVKGVASGNNILFTVQGNTGHTINWKSRYIINSVT